MTVSDKVRSVNRSCIQCRERKIKCDRQLPCSQCTTKGFPDECTRALRKKRAQNKRPFPKRQSRGSDSHFSTLPAPIHGHGNAKPSDWADRPIYSPHNSGTSSSQSESANTATPSTSASFHNSVQPEDKRRKSDRLGSDQEACSLSSSDNDETDVLASSDDEAADSPENANLLHLNTAPDTVCPFALKDVYADWRNMSIQERRSLLQEIRETLPSSKVTLHLVNEVYLPRVHSLHGSAVHLPLTRKILLELLDDPNFEDRPLYSMGHVSSALMVVVLAFHFAPVDRPVPWENGTVLEPFHHKPLRIRQRQAHAIVKRLLKFETNFAFLTIAELTTAVLLLVYQKGSQSYLEAVAEAATRSAMRMRLHRMGSMERLHNPGVSRVRIVSAETAIRIWWYLVRRDWLLGHRHRSYRILPSQFNTRLPLNLFDGELLISPLPKPHPRSTWTHVSYSLVLHDLSVITRTIVDQVNAQPIVDSPPGTSTGLASVHGQRLDQVQRDSIDQLFQSLISSLPAHYSLDTPYIADAQRQDVERWLLHQRLFHLMLQLHMPLISEADRPHGSLTYIANHILEIQGKVARVCPLLDNLRLDTLHALRACIVLLQDLFLDSSSISGLSRLMTRRKVNTSLDKLPVEDSSDTIKLCIQLVRALLSLEEQQYQNKTTQERALLLTLTSSSSSPPSTSLDAAALKTRYQKTTELLDILLNEGYWRSFRKNLANLDHLIPDWLQKSFKEATIFQGSSPPFSPNGAVPDYGYVSTPSRTTGAPTIASMLHPSTFGQTEAQPSVMEIDPSLLPDVDFSQYDLSANGATLFPSLDLELIGQQDFEGWQNAGSSLDFEKMLRDWKVEVPLNAW